MMRIALALFIASLAGCAVGPDYQRPQSTPASDYTHAADAVYVGAEPELEFWRSFRDPQLAQLVEDALARNTDLRAGVARLNAARALLRLQRLDRIPAITTEAAATRSRLSEAQAPGVPRGQRDADLIGADIDASWELDLFGRVRRGIEASRAERDAVAADLRGLQISIAAEVARTYFELRGAQEQLRVARGNADNQRESLKLTQTRLDAGRGTELDTERGRAQLESTLSRIPALEAAIAAAAHRLAVLEGREPTALLAALQAAAPLPLIPQRVAVGTPSELLRRRPDIQAAERRVAAATARVGVATADLFPRLSLGGSIGVAAANFGDLFSTDSETYAFGPRLHWAFLDLGRVRARIAANEAETDARLASYEGTVLRALEEAETALVRHAQARREGEHLAESVRAAAAAAKLARLRFDGGISDFLDVLDAERSLLDAEQRLAESRTRAGTSLVAVYKALAGGWPERPLAVAARSD